MPRLQVYLPADLHAKLKKLKLPASRLLQDAIRAEVRRQSLQREADRYIAGLVAEVGEPTAAEQAAADARVRSALKRRRRVG